MLESVLPQGQGEPVQFQVTGSEAPVDVVCAVAVEAAKNIGAAIKQARTWIRWSSFMESVHPQEPAFLAGINFL
jgi:hypothetical protein